MIVRTITLVVLFSLTTFMPLVGQTNDLNKAERAKHAAQTISTNAKNLADVKMLSSEHRKGRITSVSNDSFVLLDTKSGNSQTIAFSDVDQIKKSKKGLGTGAWIAITAGAAGAIVLGVIYRTIYCNEQAC